MNDLHKHFIGKRIIKTAIATFITAAICLWFDWPALFAVITAVVSMEPTASDSIRKGIIRFPAATIGAGFAMIFDTLLGETAFTYALAATLTILVCHKLRLEAGITVATLTALAMISETQEHHMVSFLIRLLTTLTGITVASLVNFFILRPKYYPQIAANIPKLYDEAAALLMHLPARLKTGNNPAIDKYRKLNQELSSTFSLAFYQREEWKYHRSERNTVRKLKQRQKELDNLQKFLYHLGNLQYTWIDRRDFTDEEIEHVNQAVVIIAMVFEHPGELLSNEQEKTLREINAWFKELNEGDQTHAHHNFSAKMTLVYELLSLIDISDEWVKLRHESRYHSSGDHKRS